jgi:hypothetical protein
MPLIRDVPKTRRTQVTLKDSPPFVFFRGLESQLVVLNDWKKLTAPTFEEVQVSIHIWT